MSTSIGGQPVIGKFKPNDQQTIDFLQKHAVFAETVRFKELDRKEAFYRGLEYKHQKTDWFDKPADQFETISAEAVFPPGDMATGGNVPTSEKSAREKRPTAPTRRARTTTRRYTDLLLSERRKPQIKVMGDPDTDAFLEAVRKKAKFWPMLRYARNLGGGMGAVVVTVHCRGGRWSYEVHNAKHCTPIWEDKRSWLLGGLLIMYRTQREENAFDEEGKLVGTEMVDYLCRRIITKNDEIVYKEMALKDVMDDPANSWIVEEGLAVSHKLGRFPGVWIQNTAETQDEDGDSDCEGAYETIDTNDRLIAQMFYGTLPNLDPTVVTKTDPHEVQQVSDTTGLQKGSQHAIEVGKSGDAKYMEMTGAGVTTAISLSDLLRKQTDDITGAVIPDDETMANAQSGKAMELRYAPMIARADDLRAQYGEAIEELMRITEAIARMFLLAIVQLPPQADGRKRVGKFRFDLEPRTFVKDDKVVTEDQKLGPGGYISLEWGPYFAPTEDDNQKTIKNSADAAAAGFVTKETAARRVGPVIFGVQDVDGEVQKAREQQEREIAKSLPGYGDGGVGFDDSEHRAPAAGAGGRP